MLQQHALSCQRRWGLVIAVQVGAEHVDVPEEIRNIVFRESLNNAHQHAAAVRVVATLDVAPDRVHPEIRDDGAGFHMPKYLGDLANGGHSGLLEMRERIRSVGGTWSVESQPGQGTRIPVDVPLRAS